MRQSLIKQLFGFGQASPGSMILAVLWKGSSGSRNNKADAGFPSPVSALSLLVASNFDETVLADATVPVSDRWVG
jgi:hypothetical protein